MTVRNRMAVVAATAALAGGMAVAAPGAQAGTSAVHTTGHPHDQAMAGKPDTNAVPATGVPSVMTGTQTTRATAQSKIIGYYYIKAENSKKCAEDPGWSKAKSRVLDQ